MGKFDGILLCSDWDGTLYHDNVLNDTDISAIRYFQENGGWFTLCSGRYVSYFKDFEDKIKPNTHIVALNGAYICGYEDDKPLYQGFADEYIADIIDAMLKDNDKIKRITVMFKDAASMEMFDASKYQEKREKIKGSELYKIVLYCDNDEDMLECMKKIKDIDLKDYVMTRSWSRAIEIIKEKNQKGYAIKRLAKKIGAKKIIAVGDYENDIQMLEIADVGYAVANAPEHVKSAADKITSSVYEGAIAAVIKDIESSINTSLP